MPRCLPLQAGRRWWASIWMCALRARARTAWRASGRRKMAARVQQQEQEGCMEIEMKIRVHHQAPMTNMPIVVLKDLNGEAVLPIWVGIYEAKAIALEIEKVSTPRPMTHDLIKVLLMGLDTSIKKVVVSELRDDTFYALIWLERN